ncbi:hypothetical protein ETB97_009149 [Aspergillus alliaceus]|uniref:Uncharacterized protein n=1 Tax=Petromyces alliaceus TaxID=209559 RepID=A0A8H6ADI0_PETAA|nr:hypothetical protein ETB97_009149 [Aspergillus burnettii]
MSGLLMEVITIRIICFYSEAMPLRAIWFTPLFQLCGSGSQIAASVAFTNVTDIFPPEMRYGAVIRLFRKHILRALGSGLLAEILATYLSAWLMPWSPWLPFMLGGLCESCGLLAAILIPETLPMSSDEWEPETVSDGRNHLAPAPTSRLWFAGVFHFLSLFSSTKGDLRPYGNISIRVYRTLQLMTCHPSAHGHWNDIKVMLMDLRRIGA